MSSKKLAIWWLNQLECEAIGDKPAKYLPDYLRDQYRSRYGRPARGRLWVAEQFGEVSVYPWPETAMGKFLGHGDFSAGGIVIRMEDVGVLADYPGIITDTKLKRL